MSTIRFGAARLARKGGTLWDRAARILQPGQFPEIQKRLTRGRGLEIGGPSRIFGRWHLWPIYPFATSIDLCDFASETLWQPQQSPLLSASGKQTVFGRRFVGEGTALVEVPTGHYDFLLASHVLEHLANPLAALHEWRRVVRAGGLLILVVPHRDGTFDHRRPVTTLHHVLDDFGRSAPETDLTHLDEALRLHDLSRDPGAQNRASFESRARANAKWRSLHHHVFDTELVLRLADAAGLRVLFVDVRRPYHICVSCESPGEMPDAVVARETGDPSRGQTVLLAPDAEWRRRSPFPSDRRQTPPFASR